MSPKLAALIEAVDIAMAEEFGSSRFTFTLVAGGAIVAARTIPDGLVPPLVTPAAPPTPPSDS